MGIQILRNVTTIASIITNADDIVIIISISSSIIMVHIVAGGGINCQTSAKTAAGIVAIAGCTLMLLLLGCSGGSNNSGCCRGYIIQSPQIWKNKAMMEKMDANLFVLFWFFLNILFFDNRLIVFFFSIKIIDYLKKIPKGSTAKSRLIQKFK